MDTLQLILVATASFFVIGVEGMCYKSVEETAKICLSRSMTPKISSEDLLKKDITSLTPAQMKELCHLFHNFEECIEEELYPCIENKQELKKILESFEHSFNYICHEGFELLMKIKPCTQKPDFKRQMGQCSVDAIYRFNELKMRLMTNYMIKEKACRYLQQSIDCMENTAFALCGEDARTYYHELNARAMAPTKQHLRCSEGRSFSLIGLGIFVALILALVVLVVGRYLRKRQILQEIHSETILTTRMHPSHMMNASNHHPTVGGGGGGGSGGAVIGGVGGGVVGVTATGAGCQSHLLNEATNMPLQYPQADGSYLYNQPYYYNEFDKNDFSAPPPSYEQVMAESRNQPKPL